ncbi:MAG: hypothetical protein ACKV19_10825 [Verrucomicrobiales bacterium]
MKWAKPSPELAARFTADGKQILFRRSGVEWLSSANVWAMDVDGSNLHALTTGLVDGWPNPLADGIGYSGVTCGHAWGAILRGMGQRSAGDA